MSYELVQSMHQWHINDLARRAKENESVLRTNYENLISADMEWLELVLNLFLFCFPDRETEVFVIDADDVIDKYAQDVEALLKTYKSEPANFFRCNEYEQSIRDTFPWNFYHELRIMFLIQNTIIQNSTKSIWDISIRIADEASFFL